MVTLSRRRWVARVLLVLAPQLLLGGCTSVRTVSVTSGGGGGTGSLTVRVFENRAAERSGTVTVRHVIAELWRLDGRNRELLRELQDASWTVAELAPGRYEVRVRRVVSEDGKSVDLASTDRERLDLEAGQTAVVHVVLKHPKRARVAAAVVGGVLAAVGLMVYALVELVDAMSG